MGIIHRKGVMICGPCEPLGYELLNMQLEDAEIARKYLNSSKVLMWVFKGLQLGTSI